MIAPLAANESLTKSRLDQVVRPKLCERGSNAGPFTEKDHAKGKAVFGSFFLMWGCRLTTQRIAAKRHKKHKNKTIHRRTQRSQRRL
jgi:hypothetical protein